MKINAGEIRVGMLLEYKDDLWQVLKTQHVKPGKGGAFAQVEMKSFGKNTKLNERFRSSETVEKANLEETNFNYLYSDENNHFFMDPKTFEQIEIKKNIIGEKGKLLKENLEVSVNFYNENPISVEFPNQVNYKIVSTDAALKGQTVSSSYKPAILDNGIKIQVPPFIEADDEIILDTRTFEYVKKI
ncbi:elongation factor P [Candidatus Pelagibacter sp.]|nr:elongation factor P [Candidatus Pelagibacter sp.]